MRLDFKSPRRGYTVELSEDLFGAYILRRRWYGLNNRRGGSKQQVFLSESDALSEVYRITRTREKRGYSIRTETSNPLAFSERGGETPTIGDEKWSKEGRNK